MNQWRKGIASWRIGDTLCLSVVFSWDISEAILLAAEHKGPVCAGGPAAVANADRLRGHGIEVRFLCETVEPILFHNPLATFTTRGCPNHCPWCIVPKIEPRFRELRTFRPAPVVCDNNFLAASVRHQDRVVRALERFERVDFNQGLDARLFTRAAADRLGRLKNVKVRFGFDRPSMESAVADALKLARQRTSKDLGVYCLIGLGDTPKQAREKLELVRSWGVRPTPMRYQPVDCIEKNSYRELGWTETELRRMMKYYSRLRWYEHIPYDEFGDDGQLAMFAAEEKGGVE